MNVSKQKGEVPSIMFIKMVKFELIVLKYILRIKEAYEEGDRK